jgi:hypothetical protein
MAGAPTGTSDRRRLGAGMVVVAVVLILFAVAMSERVGLFALVIVAIAAFNFVRGLLWLARG